MTPAQPGPARDRRETLLRDRDRLAARIMRIERTGGIDDPLAELLAALKLRLRKLDFDIATPPAAPARTEE